MTLINICFVTFDICLRHTYTGSQYVGAQALAEALDTVAARMPHAHVRPKFRPTSGALHQMSWTF